MWELRETRKEMQILDHGVLSWPTPNISSLLIPNIHTYHTGSAPSELGTHNTEHNGLLPLRVTPSQ